MTLICEHCKRRCDALIPMRSLSDGLTIYVCRQCFEDHAALLKMRDEIARGRRNG